ncbi:hypothetical protein H7J91_08015, partial [Mycolicibacterium rhodesiae]|nr:hypothetical protein [Mycolicibacterium rhodesiae]
MAPYQFPDALNFVDPLCPFSGKFVRTHGDEISKRIEDGSLRVNVR